MEGVEWFIYNRTPVYYALQEILEMGLRSNTNETAELKSTASRSLDVESQQFDEASSSLFRRLMPVQMECTRGSIIFGNPELPTMTVLQFRQASSIYNTDQSRSKLDHYKSSIDVILREPKMSLKHNADFTESTDNEGLGHRRQSSSASLWNHLSSAATGLFGKGARRYGYMQHLHVFSSNVDRAGDAEAARAHKEYAMVSQVFECTEIALTYFYDLPGPVPYPEASEINIANDPNYYGNGGVPPEWGVHISLRNAVMHYGPWADRQRALIQNFLFPPSNRNSEPSPILQPGQLRAATGLEMYIEFVSDVTVRVPLREKSKDWKYASGAEGLDVNANGYITRPYGWVDLKAGVGSSVKIIVPTMLSSTGYTTTLDVNLVDVNVQTSVNYASLLTCKKLKLHVDMDSPLIWNSHRTWNFNLTISQPVIYLLRDHIFLLQDLVKDWTAENTTDLSHCIPITYNIQLKLNNVMLYLCVNQDNIINNPNVIDDNAFITLASPLLEADVALPFTKFEPEQTVIGFSIKSDQPKLAFSLPSSHTLGAFLREEDAQFGSTVYATIGGSYNYYSTVDTSQHLESLNLQVKLRGVSCKLLGSIARYFLILRDNYFGNWVHFVTLEEYRHRRQNPNEYLEMKRREDAAKPVQDPFEVYIQLLVEEATALLPENLYDCSTSSQLEFQELQLELRNLDMYMDMHVNFSPLTWTRETEPNPQRAPFKTKNARDSRNYLYITELNIYAHRLFGPLPKTSTYLCNWEFDVGSISGEIKPSFLLGTTAFGKAFLYNMVDEDNALAKDPSILDPDVTFVTASIQSIDINLMGRHSATQFSLSEGLHFEFDDLINRNYTQKINLKFPSVVITNLANQEVNTESSIEGDYPWVEVANANTGLEVVIYRQTSNWIQKREKQQTYIKMQDMQTRRCPHLYDSEAYASEARSLVSMRSYNDHHHVGMLYAPPFLSKYADVSDSVSAHRDYGYMPPQQRQDEPANAYTGSSAPASLRSMSESWRTQGWDSQSGHGDNVETESINNSITESSVDFDTLSFHTALSERIEDTPTMDRNNSIFSQNSQSSAYGAEDEEVFSMRSDSEDSSDEPVNEFSARPSEAVSTLEATAVMPPSIPYSSYLRRYGVYREQPYGDKFFHTYLPPPKTRLIPAPETDEQVHDAHAHMKDPINLTQSHSRLHGDSDEDNELSDTDDTDQNNTEPLIGNETTMTIVLEATKPVNVLLTPIFVKVVQEVTEAIDQDNWDLETMLDSTQMEYIGQLTRFLTDQYVCTQFAVHLPRTHLHCIQDVMLPDDLMKSKDLKTGMRTRYDLTDTLLCSADVVLDGFDLSGLVKFQDTAFDEMKRTVAESQLELRESRVNINLGALGCKVRYISTSSSMSFGIPLSRQHPRNRKLMGEDCSSELVVIDLTLDRLRFQWIGAMTPNYVKLEMGMLSSIIITESVEILVGAVYSWLTFVDDLENILETFSEQRTKQMQTFIHEIAKFSVDPRVGRDPIFLTKPTINVLRLGAKAFRNDVGWKLLARMRHCLRSMPSTVRGELQYQLTSGDYTKKYDNDRMFHETIACFSKWRSWEIGDISTCRLFTQPFHQKQVDHSRKGPVKMMDVVDFLKQSVNLADVKLGVFDFLIYEEEPEQEDNRITIEDVFINIDTEYKLQDARGAENTQADNDRISSSDALGFLDAIGKVHVHSISIASNPTLLAFARHMLTVQRVFTTKLKTLSHAVKANNAASLSRDDVKQEQLFDIMDIDQRIDILAQCLINVDIISVNANSQRLTLCFDIEDSYGSLLFSNPKLTPVASLLGSDRATTSDTPSGLRSSNKASRKNSAQRLILSASGGIQSVSLRFMELVHVGSVISRHDLLRVDLDGVSVNAAINHATKPTKKLFKGDTTRKVLNVFSSIHSLRVNMPQSLLKVYGFVEDWRAEQGKRYNFLFQNLLDEWEEQRLANSSATTVPTALTPGFDLKLQFLLRHFGLQSDLLPSLSLQYSAHDMFILVHQPLSRDATLKYTFQLAKQDLHFNTRAKAQSSTDDPSTGSFAIPAIRCTGSMQVENRPRTAHGGRGSISDMTHLVQVSRLHSNISMDVVSLSLNVNMIDQLLTAQSLVGSEISDLVDVFTYSKHQTNATAPEEPQVVDTMKSNLKPQMLFSVDFSLRGLQVAAASPAALGVFESSILRAYVSNDTSSKSINAPLIWKVIAHNFVLSLEHNIVSNKAVANERRYKRNRLAYISIDFAVQNYPTATSSASLDVQAEHEDNLMSFFVDVFKSQVVMQPIALGKLADLYLYYQRELARKEEMKKSEIDKLAANTRRIMSSLKVELPQPQETTISLWESKFISINISNFGVAVPLDSTDSAAGGAPSKDVGALLFSISSMHFMTKKIENSNANLSNIAIQFVSRFDQNNDAHFSSINHSRMNRMLLPSISCSVYSNGHSSKQKIWIDANVNGFEVDIDGTLVDHLNKLSVIYLASVDRVNAFAAEAHFGTTRVDDPAATTPEQTRANGESALLDIEGTFVYSRGVVRLYPKRQTEHARRKTSGKNAWRVDSDIARSGDIVNMATIIIPGLSVWLTYHMPFGSLVATSQRSVHVEVLIHESENVLHPSLVQFLHEIIVGLKFGMQQSSEQKATQMTAAPNLGMNASLYLRLSKTKLDLTCQPYHKVVCSLNWEEGNFLMNSFSDDKASRTLSCVGSVLGASLNLRHHFSPEDCLSASVRDIMFNAMLTSRRAEVNEDNICVIVNVPCITAGLNIRHLQDLLVLKTLWLDQDNASSKPMEQPRNTQSSMETATTVAVAHAGSKPAPFSHYFALRAQAIDLSVDLGQAIGKVSLESQNILLTTKRIPSLSKVATLTMETIQLKSEGRLVGDARLESIRLFGYFDKLPHSLKPPQGQFCLLTKQSSAAFSYEYQNILHLIIDPISLQSGVNISSERNGGTVTTVSLNKALIQLSVKSIPVVITMYKKLDDLLDKKWAEAGLRRNQPTNKAAGLPATAVLQGVEKSTPLPSDARGEIDMNIEGIEVIIFPNLFSDTDCVQINANRIHAHLFRMMEETHTRRELQLHIADAALLKNVPGKSRERQASSNSNASAARPQMHSSVAIFGIPRTDLTMDSTQILQVLQHVFKVDFDGQINVSLNIGLIKYLQELVHQFEDQYKRALRGPTVPVESTSTATIGDKQSDDQKEETTIKEEIVDDHITLNDLEPKPKPPMKDALEYQALIPVNFQPQLQIMGEATPPVEWLGLRRDRFPAIIHEELTLNLEKILLFGWKLYQEQLEDMTFK
ncbi:Macrophage colony-stimulating factor 1 receptor [Umbelopsis sp. WA50703]